MANEDIAAIRLKIFLTYAIELSETSDSYLVMSWNRLISIYS